MSAREPETEPSEVNAEDGQVVVDGPDGVAVTMTPDAAAETSDRLMLAAAEARGQEINNIRREAARRHPEQKSGDDGS